MKNSLKILLGFSIGIILVFLWINYIDVTEMLSYWQKLNGKFILLSIIFYLSAYFFRSLRWKILLSPIIRISIFKCYSIWMAGNFLNYIIPIRAGEIGKSLFLKKLYNVPISKSLPSVFIDKFFDSIAIIVVLSLIPFLNIKISHPLKLLLFLLIVISIIGVLILLLSIFAQKKINLFFQKIFFFLPVKFKDKFYDLIEMFLEGIALFKNHLNLLPNILIITTIAILLDSIYFVTIFKAFGESIPFFMILFGYTLINLSYILPHPPAQIGSNEVIMVAIFSVGLGLNQEMVSAVMAFAHILTGILISIIGLFSLSFLGLKFMDFFKLK